MGFAGSTTCPEPEKTPQATAAGNVVSELERHSMGLNCYPFRSAPCTRLEPIEAFAVLSAPSGSVLRAGFQDFGPDGPGIGKTTKPNRFPWAKGQASVFVLVDVVVVRLNSQPTCLHRISMIHCSSRTHTQHPPQGAFTHPWGCGGVCERA